ncbi:MAG: hypothetical protein D6752_01535, partial [Candidatus Nitrosothermus koennekii]
MMKVIGKEGNDLILLALKEDHVEKGDYLMVNDNNDKALLIQMYDESYLNTESVVDDMIKDEIIRLSSIENR